jgi:glutamine amidotransferase
MNNNCLIGIIDMDTNNINCFIKILKKYNFNYRIIKKYEDYDDNIIKLIIPGIGSYNNCITYLKKNYLDKIIHIHNNKNKKILGICIGMQIFTENGIEGGIIEGLKIIKNSKTELLKTQNILPNIGWSTIYKKTDYIDTIFKNIDMNMDFYFVHSYNVLIDNIESNKYIIYYSKYYDYEFISLIKTDNLLLTQFHPEKSGPNGVNLIKNFLYW